MLNSSISTNFSEVNQALISSDMEKLFSLKQTNKEIVTPLSLLSNLKDVGEASYENLESYSDLYVPAAAKGLYPYW